MSILHWTAVLVSVHFHAKLARTLAAPIPFQLDKAPSAASPLSVQLQLLA